ncbi:Response regulator receiver domain protein [compost metagenome]
MHAATPGDGRKLQVLVIEDHPLQLRAVTMLLDQPGFIRVTRAMNAAEAFRACEPGRLPYDLAICDQNLPDLPGLVLLKRLYRDGHIRHAILLSSLAEDELADLLQRGRELRLPLLACLAKPLDLESFQARIAPLLDGP